MNGWRASDKRGQALLELLGSVSLLIATSAGAAWLGQAQWSRVRCAYLAFETAHAARSGRSRPRPPAGASVRLEAARTAFHAVAACGGGIREDVTLPRLEPGT